MIYIKFVYFYRFLFIMYESIINFIEKMIKPQAISWFWENLPDSQLVEENFKNIIKKNYSLSGFTPIDTPAVERLEILTSKWADDNEIYGLHRINWEVWDDASLWLRFDLTVPLARYVAQYEWELTFPFRRQHIARVYRWERPQKWRYREFYQADVDIIWNWKLSLFADVEVLSTIYNSLKELDFGEFKLNINNKKFLSGFLESIWIEWEKIVKTIWVIDKKDKVRWDKLKQMYLEVWIQEIQIEKIREFITFWEENNSLEIIKKYSSEENELLKEGITELSFVYNSLIDLWVEDNFIKINPAISRGLNYYTWTVFETFISGAEKMWSISSGWRYENLCGNFTKNPYPGVGGSIWLSRLLAVLNELNKIELWAKTVSKALVLNMWEDTLKNNLELVNILRKNKINTELYLEDAKMQKQLKYANNKWITFAIICWTQEIENNILVLKNLDSGEQFEIKKEELLNYIK